MRRRRYATTLAIDDDVLAAAKAMAEQQRRSVGDVIPNWPAVNSIDRNQRRNETVSASTPKAEALQ